MQFRDYAADPAPSEPSPDDPRLEEQDRGNVVAFEHINLEVRDLEVGRLFYSEVLGLTPDPSMSANQRGGAHITWYNIGRQQFHIAKGQDNQTMPPGAVIGIVLPHVDAIPAQAAAMRPMLGELPVTLVSPGVLRITDPHGVTFQVHRSIKGFGHELGIAYLHLPCFVGTSAMFGRFYSQTLGAPVKLRGHPSESTAIVPSCTIDPDPTTTPTPDNNGALSEEVVGPAVVPKQPAGPVSPARRHTPVTHLRSSIQPPIDIRSRIRAHVTMGVPGTELVFYEEPELGPWSTQRAMALYSGWHMCFYVSQYSPCYMRLRTLLFNTHPYPDKVHNFSDALKNHQFRFQDIVLLPDSFSQPPLMLEANKEPADSRRTTTDGVSNSNNSETALVSKAAMSVEPIQSLVATYVDDVTDTGAPCRVGQLLYRISHEVRSLSHPLFMRPLFNRSTQTLN